jgi:hypothetical protein
MATHRLREPIDQKMEKCPRPTSPPRTAQPPPPPIVAVARYADQSVDRSPRGPYLGPLFVGSVMLRGDAAPRKHLLDRTQRRRISGSIL